MFGIMRIDYYHFPFDIFIIKTHLKNFVLTYHSQKVSLYRIQLVLSSEQDNYLLDNAEKDL